MQLNWITPITCVALFLLSSGAARSQSASDQMSEKPLEAYAVIKEQVWDDYKRLRSSTEDEDLVDGDLNDADATPDSSADDSEFVTVQQNPLSTCGAYSDRYVVEGELRNTLVALAFDLVAAENQLQIYGYPHSVWKETLNEFEEQQLRNVDAGFRIHMWRDYYYEFDFEALSDSINRNIASSGLKLIPTIARADCGGGPAHFRIRIKQNSLKAQLLPEVFYRYCLRISADISDDKVCDFWQAPIADGETVPLGGLYRYRMLSRTGASAISLVDFDRFIDGDTVELPR